MPRLASSSTYLRVTERKRAASSAETNRSGASCSATSGSGWRAARMGLPSDSLKQHLAGLALVLLPLGGKLVGAERRHSERREGTQASAFARDLVHGEVHRFVTGLAGQHRR